MAQIYTRAVQVNVGSKSFGQSFSKDCGSQGQSLWSPSADGEIPLRLSARQGVNFSAVPKKRGKPAREAFPCGKAAFGTRKREK